jgi:glycerol-3-phosphate dehydrogenase
MGYTPHVLVLGGGVTGTGIARDLAIRGLDVTLVERESLTSGATGRMQGLLYSGARYADADPTVAEQCLAENRTLTEIAGHCVEETGGLLVTMTPDDDAFDSLVAACRDCGILVEELTAEEAREKEPGLGPDVERAVAVPDAAVDPFRLTVATARSAIEFGAEIRPHTEVTDVHVEDGAVAAVTVEHDPGPAGRPGFGTDADGDESDDEADEIDDDGDDPRGDGDIAPDGGRDVPGASGGPGAGRPGEAGTTTGMPGASNDESPAEPTASTERIEPDYVVNATGAWADTVAELAGFSFPMHRSRAAMVVTDDQPVGTAVSQGVTAGTTGTVVPHGQHCVVGATNEPADGPADFEGDGDGAEQLLATLADVVPSLADARLLRTFWGVRSGPPRADSEGRPFALADHADRDGCWGMLSVVGGTLTTHRLVAERVADHVCGEFGITRECRTDELPLPGSEGGSDLDLEAEMDRFGLDSPVYERSRDRLGSRALEVLATGEPNPVVCEAESVTRAEIRDALEGGSATPVDLDDVRTRTSAAMGACQGGRCGHRIAAELYPDYEHGVVDDALDDLLAERWKGQRHALWGEALARAARSYRFHAETLGRKHPSGGVDVTAFDDGPAADDGRGPPTAGWRGAGR